MLKKIDTLKILGSIIAIRAVLFGANYAFNRPDAMSSVLYEHISSIPVVTPVGFGWLLMITGLISLTGFIIGNKKFVKRASEFQFLVLLFTSVIYFSQGSIISGIVAALIPAALTAVVSIAFYYRPTDDEERKYYGFSD